MLKKFLGTICKNGPKLTNVLNQNAAISTTAQLKNEKTSSTNLAHYGRGTGGRSSFSGNVVTVFGANGMIGRILANRLGKEGSQLIVPYRGDPWDVRSIKLVGDLGQVLFQVNFAELCNFKGWCLINSYIQQEIDVRNPDLIRKAIQYSNIVINALGTDYETRFHFL